MKIQAVFESAEEGGFTVYVPLLPGCISEGNTFDEAVENIREVGELYLETDDEELLIDMGDVWMKKNYLLF